jgi:site-specific DNA recombinase
MAEEKKRQRCVIYTRKSSEQGLEQEFNSLDAQREACEAFVRSQASLGWSLVPGAFDDGGLSGGSMERPALLRLLDEVRAGRVDVVIVYKIDRLTRSLADFAKMVEIFDRHGVSFVSVTQQFNTTSSMGRLTLNVLLSFAQFEREVTAERIRDKVAASKKKGIWMGGTVPIGYRAINRKLVIHKDEAAFVKWLFERYDSGNASLQQLAADATRAKIMREPRKGEGQPAPRQFMRGQIAYILANPIYVAKIRHGELIYEGEHQPIIGQELYDRVQDRLKGRAARRASQTNFGRQHLLAGILVDEAGDPLWSVHTQQRGIRYRYYVSRPSTAGDQRKADAATTAANLISSTKAPSAKAWRLASTMIEPLIESELQRVLTSASVLDAALSEAVAAKNRPAMHAAANDFWSSYLTAEPEARRKLIQTLVDRILLTATTITIGIRLAAIDSATDPEAVITIERPMQLRRRGHETKLVLQDQPASAKPDRSLVDLLKRAHLYLASLTDGSGRGISDVANADQVDRSDFSRVLRCAFLAPDITTAIIEGRQPVDLTATKLLRLADLPQGWDEQRALLMR